MNNPHLPLLIYIDKNTTRVIRSVEFDVKTCPADIINLSWMVVPRKLLPREAFSHDTIHLVTHNFMSGFSVVNSEITKEDLDRFGILDGQAECLEELSRSITTKRYTKNKNMFGNVELKPEYLNEIAIYNDTAVIGPLLNSLITNDNDVNCVIAEFTIKNQTYINHLIESEVVFNQWSAKIKTSTTPREVFKELKETLGYFDRLK